MPAKSKAQQRFFGMVRAAQKGEMKNPSSEVVDAADSMKVSDVKKFAKTKHKGLPEKKKVDEEVELDERLGGKGYKRRKDYAGRTVEGDWPDSDRGAGNKAKKRAGGKVEKKSPTYRAYVLNKEEVVDEKFATQYKDKSKLGQSSQRKSLGRGASINPDAKPSGYESKKEHRVTSKKLAPYQTKGTYNAHIQQEGVGRAALLGGVGAAVAGPVGAAAGAALGASMGKKKITGSVKKKKLIDISDPYGNVAKAKKKKVTKEELQLEGKKTKKKPTEKYKIRVTHHDDEGGKKTYVRFADRDRINKLRQKGDVQSVEMTAHGEPTDGSSKKTNTKTPAIKKVKKKEPKIDKNKEMKEGVLADKMRANNKALKAKWDKRGKKATEDAYRALDDVKRTQDAMDKEMKEGVIARIKQGAKQHAAALEKRRYDKAMSTKGSPERKAEAQHLRNVRFNMQGRGPTSDTETPKDKKRKKISKILRDQD